MNPPHSGLPEPSAGPELTVADVAALAGRIADGAILLVDCREDDEWRFNRLPDARLVALSRFAEDSQGVRDEGKPVIVYCHHGMRSLQAVAWLRAHGLDRSWSMRGGIDRWSREIDPSVPVY